MRTVARTSFRGLRIGCYARMKLFGAWFLPLCNGYFVLSRTRPRIYWARSLQWPNYSDAVIPELSTAFVLKLPLNSPFSLCFAKDKAAHLIETHSRSSRGAGCAASCLR
jgi:hypothetical protein